MMRTIIIGLFAAGGMMSAVQAQPPAAGPAVTIALKDRQSSAVPARQGFAHTGGGNIDVTQPAPDTVVVTMTGVAVAGAHPFCESRAALTFDLDQALEIGVDAPKVKRARLTLEGRIVGALRSHKGGGKAEQGPAHAAILSGTNQILGLDLPSHAVSGGGNCSVNDRTGPAAISVGAGEYRLHQTFAVSACHPSSLRMCRAASSEFAPDPALDPLWISYWEPFHGAVKKDFGFQVILKVVAESDPAPDKR